MFERTFDSVGWRLTRDWTKVGDTWEVADETFDGSGPWFGDNHAYGRSEDGRYIWNRYDARLNGDGSLTLSMTPDVPANPRFVPEPGTLAIVGIAAAGLLTAGWRKRFGKTAARLVM